MRPLSEPRTDVIGQTVSPYRILDKLRRGRCVVVYYSPEDTSGWGGSSRSSPAEDLPNALGWSAPLGARTASALSLPPSAPLTTSARPRCALHRDGVLEGERSSTSRGRPLRSSTLELARRRGGLGRRNARGILPATSRPRTIFVTRLRGQEPGFRPRETGVRTASGGIVASADGDTFRRYDRSGTALGTLAYRSP